MLEKDGMDSGGAKRCGACGGALGADAVFCGKCGTRYAPSGAAVPIAPPPLGRACPRCRQTLAWDQLFCPGCGHNCVTV